jgi:hypothetical protein
MGPVAALSRSQMPLPLVKQEHQRSKKIAYIACQLFTALGAGLAVACLSLALLTVSVSCLKVGVGALLVSVTAYYLRDLFKPPIF